MKQSNSNIVIEITSLKDLYRYRYLIDPATIAALYVRLSRDDNFDGDSYSIANQKKLLIDIAKDKGYTCLLIFCDDGISGVTMNRPGFQLMLQAVEMNIVSAVFVKDLSRIGRNYIEVGKLTEEVFPEHDIRLVAVSDNLDTDEGESEFTPIKNLFNEWYSRDISKKRRISNKIKGTSGEPLGPPPYGYMKDPANPKRWIIDDEAADVVRRIFRLAADGYGPAQIAAMLSKEHILIPVFYQQAKGINRPVKIREDKEPGQWNTSSVRSILAKQEYCGDVLNFKTYSKSYKNKKRLENAPENMMIFKDVHEPVIERELWERVQQKRSNSIIRQNTKNGTPNIFAGLLFCADCGGALNFHFNQKNRDIKYYNCGNNNSCQKTCTTTHYIRLDFLEQVVLAEVRRLAQFAVRHEDEFMLSVAQRSKQVADMERKSKERELAALRKRDRELDTVFERLYEDNISGKVSDERYAKMSAKYESEQAEISELIKTHSAELEKIRSRDMTTDTFAAMVSKYTRARKLTQAMLNELIDRIEVYHAEKIDGVTTQRLTIRYNCIGSIALPEVIAAPEVTVQTRRGVEVSYAAAFTPEEERYAS